MRAEVRSTRLGGCEHVLEVWLRVVVPALITQKPHTVAHLFAPSAQCLTSRIFKVHITDTIVAQLSAFRQHLVHLLPKPRLLFQIRLAARHEHGLRPGTAAGAPVPCSQVPTVQDEGISARY